MARESPVKWTRRKRGGRGNAGFLLENTRNIGGGGSDQRRLVEIRTGRVGRAGGIAANRHERKMDAGNPRGMRDFRGHRHAVRAIRMMVMMLQRALLVVRRIAGSIRLMPVILVTLIAMLVQAQCG